MYIVIDSRDRTVSGDSTGKFSVRLSNSISNVNFVKLKQVLINHKIYNISSEYSNQTFTFSEGTPTSFNITAGNYTPSQLASHIEAGLNGTSAHTYLYTVAYSDITYKFTITSTGSFLVSSTALTNIMGFSTATSSAMSQVSDKLSTIDDYNYLCLDISCLPKSFILSNGMSTTFILPNSGTSQEYSGLLNQCYTMMTPISLQNFSIYLKNRDGTEAILNNTNWSIILECGFSK